MLKHKNFKKKKKYIIFIKNNFEKKGFYISYKWFWLKKKNNFEKKKIKYIVTDWYVIPEPSEDSLKKDKKVKYTFFNKNFKLIYDRFDVDYDPLLDNWDLIYWLKEVYSPNKFSTLPKFNISLKFEFFWLVWQLFFFFKWSPLCYQYKKFFFSFKQLKLFSLKIIDAFFEKFINPNKPLIWKKSERLLPKKRGLSLLWIWKIIYRQLVYEILNKKFFFTKWELKLLKNAEVDPYDNRYYWPTRRLYLLNLSTFSGKISDWVKTYVPRIYFHIKHFLVVVERELWLRIFLQILFWRNQFVGQVIKNLLFHNQLSPVFENDKLRINNYSIPYFYYGYQNQYFKKNFLFFELESYDVFCEELHQYLKVLKQTASSYLSIFFVLTDINYTRRLAKWNYVVADSHWILSSSTKENSIYAVVTFKWILDSKDTQQIFSNHAKIIENLTVEDINPEIFQKMNLGKRIPGVYPIPAFLRELFLLCSTKLVNLAMLEEQFIKRFLYNHPLYKKALDVSLGLSTFIDYSSINVQKQLYIFLHKFKKFKFNPLFWYWISLLYLNNFSRNFSNFYDKLEKKYNYDYVRRLLMFKPKSALDKVLFPAIKSFNFFFRNIFLAEKKYFFQPWQKFLFFFNIHFFLTKIKKNMFKKKIPFKYFLFKHIFFFTCLQKNAFKFFKWGKHRYYWRVELKNLKNTSFSYFTELSKYIEWFQTLLDPTIEPVDINKNFFEIANLIPDHFQLTSNLKKKKLLDYNKSKISKTMLKWFKLYHFNRWLNLWKHSFLLQLFGVQLKFIHKNTEVLHSNSVSFYQNFCYFSSYYFYSLHNQSTLLYLNYQLSKKNFFSFLHTYFLLKNKLLQLKLNIILRKTKNE